MTNTIEALDRFTQALDIFLPKPGPARHFPGGAPARDRTAAGPEPPGRGEAAVTGPPVQSAEHDTTEVKAAEPAPRRPAPKRIDGITRQGPRCDWQRPVRLVGLALAIGLGLSFVVRGSERAAQRYGRQWAQQSFASSAHDHLAQVASHRAAAPHHVASPHHRTHKRVPGRARRSRVARRARG